MGLYRKASIFWCRQVFSNQQTQNANPTSLLILLDTFSSFVRDGAKVKTQNIQQFTTLQECLILQAEMQVLQNTTKEDTWDVELDLV